MLFKRTRPAIQQCPICGAKQPLDTARCSQCGAALNGVPIGTIDQVTQAAKRKNSAEKGLTGPLSLEWHKGETDLHEAELPAFSWSVVFFGTVTCAFIIWGVVYLLIQNVNT